MLFEQIESNKRKTIGIIFLFVLLSEVFGAALGYYVFSDYVMGIVIVSIVLVFYLPFSILSSTKIVMRMNHAKKILNFSDYPYLWHTVEGLALAARVPMPELYIIQENSPNAFAAGTSPEKAAVAVTTALLNKLNKEEIEAVIAHEIAHIKNYDVRLSTVSLAIVSVIAFISDYASRVIFSSKNDNKNPILLISALVIILLSPLLAYILHFSLSRNREYLADAVGADLCRNPVALASALIKISEDTDPVDNIPKSAASLYFSEPTKLEQKRRKKVNLFSTHPPVNERVERLMNM